MKFPRSICRLYFATCLLGFAAPAETPSPQSDDSDAFHIAIIGAGVAGAFAAYNLYRLSASGIEQKLSLKITVYESSPIVGGQVKTISPPGSEHTLEAGASYFFEDDWCLSDTARSLGLERRPAPQSAGTMIWNGYRLLEDSFCFNDASRAATPHFWYSIPSNILQTVKIFITRNLAGVDSEWEDGAVPLRFRPEIIAMQDRLKSLGRNNVFSSLHDELNKVGLGDIIKSSAEQFLRTLAVPNSFQIGVVEPCIEALFGLDIKEATGLHVVASMGSNRSQPVAILPGNGKLIARMLHESGARLHMDSQVTKVETGSQRRVSLTITSTKSTKQTHEEHDVVIFTGDSMARLRSQGSKSSLKTSQRHVTHFSTAHTLNPNVFGVKLGWNPSTLLTTANSSYLDSKTRIMRLTTFPEFYIDRSDCHWDDECDQFVNVHRVDSRAPISETKLRLMAEGIRNPGSNPVMWIHTQSWNHRLPINNNTHSDAVAYQIEPDPTLLNANSDLINTMEISCRMGRNAALKLLQTPLLSNGLPQGEQVADF
ncbi:hypothetical protein E0Z10_g10784 [Xylaria hypoxylon]|uniref:Prenylcysteine lyase domain-containing protein n=1 Tax=Xylaria hypoxylon TaxID=37992 RepID=A0A4Z0YC96_9PEZI|nr:hypothetical protein E0Z10_g10784 [Xylaria hypoxylon]